MRPPLHATVLEEGKAAVLSVVSPVPDAAIPLRFATRNRLYDRQPPSRFGRLGQRPRPTPDDPLETAVVVDDERKVRPSAPSQIAAANDGPLLTAQPCEPLGPPYLAQPLEIHLGTSLFSATWAFDVTFAACV